MNPLNTKVRLIFLPFLIISVCTIIFYTFFNWLLLIKLKAVKIDDGVVNIIAPLLLPWAPLLIWLRQRLKLLKLKTYGRNNPAGAILLLNGITIAIPLIFAQMYLVTATGKLTRLENMGQINILPETKYYTVKHFYINKRLVHVKTMFTVSGKYNSDFNMTIYAPVPVFDHIYPDTNLIAAMENRANKKALVILNGKLSTMQLLKKLPADSILRMRYLNPTAVMRIYGDTGKYGAVAAITKGYKVKGGLPVMKMSPAAWLAVKYNKTISNSLSMAEKKLRFRAFATKSDTDFRRKRLDRFTYLDRIPYNSKDLKHYTEAITLRGDVADSVPVILLPVFEPYENRNGNKLALVFGYFGIGAAIFLLILSLVSLKPGIIEE